MADKAGRRAPLVALIRRAVGRPYLLMAAVVLVLGAIWFTRLALQEFLLIDRLINVYTNDAQIKMDAYPIKAGVTAEVLEVLVKEGERVQKDQVLVRLVPDDLQAEMRRAEAIAEGIQQQIDELRLELPLALQQAKTRWRGRKPSWRRRRAPTVALKSCLRCSATVRTRCCVSMAPAWKPSGPICGNTKPPCVMPRRTWRMRSLAEEGIVSQDRLDSAHGL